GRAHHLCARDLCARVRRRGFVGRNGGTSGRRRRRRGHHRGGGFRAGLGGGRIGRRSCRCTRTLWRARRGCSGVTPVWFRGRRTRRGVRDDADERREPVPTAFSQPSVRWPLIATSTEGQALRFTERRLHVVCLLRHTIFDHRIPDGFRRDFGTLLVGVDAIRRIGSFVASP